MAQPAVSPFHEPKPVQPDSTKQEAIGPLGEGPVAALQQMLVERVGDWPEVNSPFRQDSVHQRIEMIVSSISRVSGYVCFAGALIGVGYLIAIA